MSVNIGLKFKRLLVLLILGVLSTNALLIRQKTAAKTTRLSNKETSKAKARNAGNFTSDRKAPAVRRKLGLQLEAKNKRASRQKQFRKSKPSLKPIHKSMNRWLSDSQGSIMPVIIAALLAFLMISAPFYGFMLFGIPLFLDLVGKVWHENCKRKGEHSDHDHNGRLLRQIKRRLDQGDLFTEEKKLMKFLKHEKVKFGQPIGKKAFLKLLKKYTINDKRFKGKKTQKQLKTVVDAIYKNQQKIFNVLKSAT